MKFEIRQEGAKWSWVLKGKDGRVLCGCPGFNGEGEARRALKAFKHSVDAAPVVVIKTQGGE